jgi:hypothetical protein
MEMSPVDERLQFVTDAQSEAQTALHRQPARRSNHRLEETDDGVCAIYFNTVLLGTLNERDYIIRG